MSNTFEQDCQRLVSILNKTQSGNTDLIREAEKELTQIESNDGFVPFLLKFISLPQIPKSNGCNPQIAASIRLKNLIQFKWSDDEKQRLCDKDKQIIRSGLFEQCMKQKDAQIRRQLFAIITFLIGEDFPQKWPDLLANIAKCIQTNNPYMILGGLSILLSIYKKYHFVSRQRSDNQIERMIDETWPTLCNILNVSLDLYSSKLSEQQGAINHELSILLNILKIIFRIFFICIFMDFPKHLQNNAIFEKWMNLFLKFLKIPSPKDLKLATSNKERLRIDSLYSIDASSKYYNNPYVKTRKWAVRCITRILQLYGRPQYVMEKELKPFAEIFMSKYARSFMEQFYFGIIRQHIGDQFVYFKTLAPAITYINLCIHYGKLFQLLLENNAKYLDHILFECMFRIVRLTASDLSRWQDDPQGFVENSFRFGLGAMDDSYDPRSCALKFIADTVRIRSRYTFDKLLQFSQKMIRCASECNKNSKEELEIMVNKDAVLCILGHLANILRKAKDEKYVIALKELIMHNVVPDFDSNFGFLRARACWLVGKYWKLQFKELEWQQIGLAVIKSLHDKELPVQMEASAGLSKIVLEKSSTLIEFIKPQIPSILGRYLEIMNDIGTEAVVQTFDTLIDRLDHGIIPFATDLLSKMLTMFSGFHSGVEKYVRLHPEEYEKFLLPTGNYANTNLKEEDRIVNEAQKKEELKQFDDALASACQCLKAIHTILFASTALSELLAKLEELMKPLISSLFNDNYLFFQFYIEEIMDMIHLFSFYMSPLSIFEWQIFPKILEGYCCGIWSNEFNRCSQSAVNFIKAAKKLKLPFCNFVNQNFMDITLTFGETAINDDNVNILMFVAMYENLLCSFKECDFVDIGAYMARILEMAMTKYTESNLKPETQGAMLAIVALCAYNNPTLFIQLLEQNKTTDFILSILMNNYKDLMWPQQKAMVFGLSSLLLIEKQNIPSNLGQKYMQLIDVTAKCVTFMNWEEYEEEEDADDEDEEEDDEEEEDNAELIAVLQADEDEEKEATMEDEDEEEEEESDDDGLIDVDANEDYVDGSDIRHMANCCNQDQEWMMELMYDFDDSSGIVPRSQLDEENEVIFFNDCLNKFAQNGFSQIVDKWKQGFDDANKKLLAKYLKESQENMEDYQKRKVANKKEKAEREQTARKAIEAAKVLQQQQQ